jgi:NitT/TauT family transport system ATP-binding protein
MQQRVAIARAIASRPGFLLMDEPFASVDAQTRAQLESMVLDLWREFGWTVLLVTHDIDEAIFMADRVLVLSKRPSRVLREVPVSLDRPRDQIETRARPEFQQYRKEIISLIGATP